jgi:PAS domain S-box-containing protein
MIHEQAFPDEATRLEAVRQYAVLDTLPEEALNDLTAMAAQICGTPIALISLVDKDRQWFKARVGLEAQQTPRRLSFCAHALKQREIFTVPDATKDVRFADNELVTGGPRIRFYAGAPLITPENATLGTLCVIDRTSRTLTPEQEHSLQILARQVMTHLELRRQMAALRLSEENFSNAFEHAPIGMALVSPEGRWLKVNQATCNLLGYSAEELWSKTFQDITHPDDLETDLGHVQDLLAGKTSSYHMEKRYFHKDGHIVWAELGVSLVSDKQNQPLYFISQIQDITENIATMARQKELLEKSQAAEKAKSEFLAIMSHEMRTPLNGVIGMTSILADMELNDMQRECVETINISGESLLAVINDILDYSKIEAGRLQMEYRSFNLRQCVEEAFDLFASQIRLKHLEAAYLIAPDIPAHLTGDSLRLRQVLVNILGNAIKFTARGEISVNVECTQQDETACHLKFSVSDTGIGISPEGIEKLFHAFQQGDTSTTRRYGGSGLGLVISKRLAEFMGGTLWVESELGLGSTFIFTVVLQPAPEDSAKSIGVGDLLKGRSVLLVDDNATNRRILDIQLKFWGMDATCASTGAEALKIVGRQNFDVVLIDMQMPEMDGIMLAQKIRSSHSTPLILLSSSTENVSDEERDLFQYQISKPIKHSVLMNALLKVTGVDEGPLRKTSGTKLDSHLGEKHPLRLLLAEDNSVNQKVALMMLGRLGYSAEVVGNGKLALAALEKSTYDVILMDIQMPEMNGIEAARLVHEKMGDQSPVILALTAEALEGDEERFLALGFDSYLSKPLQAHTLEKILKAIQPRT